MVVWCGGVVFSRVVGMLVVLSVIVRLVLTRLLLMMRMLFGVVGLIGFIC